MVDILIVFMIGFVIGGLIGIIITCLCVVNNRNEIIDDDEYYEWCENETRENEKKKRKG